MNINIVSPQQLHAMWKQDKTLTLLDVRSEAEYRAEHIAGAKHLPLDELNLETINSSQLTNHAGKKSTLYLTCASGFRAQQAANRLLDMGFDNLGLLEGGTVAWKKVGLPMDGATRPLSLQQQFQIALGILLLIKVLFGYTIHELFFIAIPVLAIGLIVAGLSNWDGPTRLFTLLPWNQKTHVSDQSSP